MVVPSLYTLCAIYIHAPRLHLPMRHLSALMLISCCFDSIYWVVTWPSFSTLMCSLEDRVWTLSSGKEALHHQSVVVHTRYGVEPGG